MQPMHAPSSPSSDMIQLKESIRDMIRLQRDYKLSDELFWEVFNTRVLLNEQVDVDAFITALRLPTAQA